MKVRLAELRDLPELKAMFLKLLDYLKGCGQWALSDNQADVENGVVGFLLSKMGMEENIVLVAVDEGDTPIGFLSGWILNYPPFYRHRRVGEIQFCYPMSFSETPYMLKEFEKWARELGATAETNYSSPGNEKSIKCMERSGRRLVYHHHFKPYEVKP